MLIFKIIGKITFLLINVFLMILVFVWDIYTPLGIADGILYVVVILSTLWLRETRYTMILATMATLFIILGYYFSPQTFNVIESASINRALSIISTWVTVILIHMYGRSEKRNLIYKERLKAFFEYSEEAIMVSNSENFIKMANPKFLELLGYNESELIGKKIDDTLSLSGDFLNKNDIHEINQNTSNLLSDNKLSFLLTKNTTPVPVEIHKWSFGSSKEKNNVYFIKDITEAVKQNEIIRRSQEELLNYYNELKGLNAQLEEKVSERTNTLSQTVVDLENINKLFEQELVEKQEAMLALEESQQMQEMIARNFPNGSISVIDKEFRYLFADGQELENLGLSANQLVGKIFLPLNNKIMQNEVKKTLVKAFNGEKISFEYCNNNEVFLLNGTPIHNSNNEISQVLMVSQNITTLKKAENDIKIAFEKEHSLNELKSRFVTTASHEFRTPLTAIISSTSLMKMYNNFEDPRIIKHTHRIESSANHLTEILNNFLSLGKIEEGKVSNNPVEFDINNLLKDIIEEISLTLKTGQNLRINKDIGDSRIILDKYLLRNVLVNLLSNAAKYSNENSNIYITFKKQKKDMFFSVKDEGIGIPIADQRHLFETFYRASNVENINGTGMGLHIVKRYVNIMNGRIEFESASGIGSCFTITFPN